MSLPTVIIFERHWDPIPKLLIKELLPDLSQKGYATLCFEAPYDLSSAEIVNRHNIRLEFDSNTQKQVEQLLKQVGIISKLSDMSFSRLTQLLKLHVSSQKYVDVAEMIKQLPASYVLKEIFDEVGKLSISVKGIDIESEKFDEMISVDLSKRMSGIRINESLRITTLFQNLLKLRSQQDEGIIFACGLFHAKGLLEEFKKHHLQDEVLYYCPHSSSNYDDSINDIQKLAINATLADHTYLLSQAEIRSFKERIIHEIAGKIKYKIDNLDENSHAQFLSQCFKTNVIALLRPGYHVDALVDIDDSSDINNIRQHVAAVGVQTHDVLFNKRRYLVIPNVNDVDVADRIRKISTFS